MNSPILSKKYKIYEYEYPILREIMDEAIYADFKNYSKHIRDFSGNPLSIENSYYKFSCYIERTFVFPISIEFTKFKSNFETHILIDYKSMGLINDIKFLLNIPKRLDASYFLHWLMKHQFQNEYIPYVLKKIHEDDLVLDNVELELLTQHFCWKKESDFFMLNNEKNKKIDWIKIKYLNASIRSFCSASHNCLGK